MSDPTVASRQVRDRRASSARARWASSTRRTIRTSSAPSRIKTVRKDLLDADLAAHFIARLQQRGAGRRAAAPSEHRRRSTSTARRDNIAYIVMEYVDGTGLREYLNRKARFELAADRRDPHAAARGARVRARAGRRPSRHQAGEPDPDAVRRAQGRRLRHRAHRRVEPDDDRHGDRHAVLHGARAVPGPAERPPRGPVQRRRACSTSS